MTYTNQLQGSRENGKYYATSFANKNGNPVELIELECCGHIKEIPIKYETDYINYAMDYKHRCPICKTFRPKWKWGSWDEVEYICYWE